MIDELKSQGIRVIVLDRKIERKEFLQMCAKSYLVWSPEGGGWDCYRHYEAAYAGSVPIINYPTIQRHYPLVDQCHALYYGIEGDHLKQVIMKALADRECLITMGQAGRKHVLKHHTHEALAQYVLTEISLTPVSGNPHTVPMPCRIE